MSVERKPTVIHYALVTLVMLTIILGMTAFQLYLENQQLRSEILRLNQLPAAINNK